MRQNSRVRDISLMALFSALTAIGAQFLRDIKPGEIVTITREGITSNLTLCQSRQAHCICDSCRSTAWFQTRLHQRWSICTAWIMRTSGLYQRCRIILYLPANLRISCRIYSGSMGVWKGDRAAQRLLLQDHAAGMLCRSRN